MKENVDTYVLPEDSNVFLAEVLPASNPLRITWEVLTVEEKAGYLSAALQKIENLNFIGDKAFFFQPLKFPRIARGLPVNFDKTPLEVKRAQVLWAADIMREELYLGRRNKEACVALGLLEETLSETASIEHKVKELLHRWISSWRVI